MRSPIKAALAASVLASAGGFGLAGFASAQEMPTPLIQEVLIKSSLLTFNDAIVTDNFTVLHAKASKPFRDQFTPDKLRASFKRFVEGHAVFDVIVAKPPIASVESKIDKAGELQLNGYFDVAPNKLKYQLDYIRSEGDWKLSGLNVKIE